MNKNYIHSSSLGMLSGKVHGGIKKELQRQLDARDIPLKVEHFPVINKLMEQDGVTQQVIADFTGFDRPRTSRMIDELENAGLVIRKDDPESRRNKLIYLSETINSNKDKITESILASFDVAFEGFSQEEQDDIVVKLQKIKNNLEK